MRNRLLSPTRSRVLATVALSVAAAAVWAFGVFEVGFSQSPVEFNYQSLLGTTNRSSFKLCVDSKTAAVSNAALRDTVEGYVERLKQHPHFVASGLAGNALPQVDVGCPGTARLNEPNFDWRGGNSDLGGVGVSTPTPYLLYVYVVPQDQLGPLANAPVRGVPQEVYCPTPGACAEVSRAVYLTPSDVPNASLVVRELATAAGLLPEYLPATP